LIQDKRGQGAFAHGSHAARLTVSAAGESRCEMTARNSSGTALKVADINVSKLKEIAEQFKEHHPLDRRNRRWRT
jgi:hypothetical protein